MNPLLFTIFCTGVTGMTDTNKMIFRGCSPKNSNPQQHRQLSVQAWSNFRPRRCPSPVSSASRVCRGPLPSDQRRCPDYLLRVVAKRFANGQLRARWVRPVDTSRFVNRPRVPHWFAFHPIRSAGLVVFASAFLRCYPRGALSQD